jgi:hypothetical protein
MQVCLPPPRLRLVDLAMTFPCFPYFMETKHNLCCTRLLISRFQSRKCWPGAGASHDRSSFSPRHALQTPTPSSISDNITVKAVLLMRSILFLRKIVRMS